METVVSIHAHVICDTLNITHGGYMISYTNEELWSIAGDLSNSDLINAADDLLTHWLTQPNVFRTHQYKTQWPARYSALTIPLDDLPTLVGHTDPVVQVIVTWRMRNHK